MQIGISTKCKMAYMKIVDNMLDTVYKDDVEQLTITVYVARDLVLEGDNIWGVEITRNSISTA